MNYLTKTALCLMAILLPTQAASATSNIPTNQTKKILTMTQSSWIAFRDYNGQQLVYFTHLEAWKCGLKQVRYGLNGQPLDQVWPLDDCDLSQPNSIAKEHPYLSFPLRSITSIDVELIYSDNTKSGPVRFNAP